MTHQELIDEGYTEGKKSFDFLSKEIFREFNWQKVYTAMKAVEWNWFLGTDNLGKDNYGIPSLQTIQNHAYALLKTAYDERKQISTGGFTAGWDGDEFYLVFTLQEASAS